MGWLALVGGLIFVFVCAVVGSRLLIQGVRTRHLPELLMGTSFVVGAVLGYTVDLVVVLTSPPPDTEHFLYSLVGVCGAVASSAVPLAAWAVFRLGAPWAGFLAGALVALHIPMVLHRLPRMPGSLEAIDHPLYWAWTIARIVGYGWMTAECLLRYRILRRRHSLGVEVDPLLAIRILFWGLAHALVALMFVGWTANLVLERFGYGTQTAYIVSALGTPTAALMWLSFFPPRMLRRWARRWWAQDSPPLAA